MLILLLNNHDNAHHHKTRHCTIIKYCPLIANTCTHSMIERNKKKEKEKS